MEISLFETGRSYLITNSAPSRFDARRKCGEKSMQMYAGIIASRRQVHPGTLPARNPYCLPRGDDRSTTGRRSEEHKSELQSLMRISYAVLCMKKKQTTPNQAQQQNQYQHTHNQLH